MNDDIQKEAHERGLYFVHKDLFVDLYNAKVFNFNGKVYLSMLEYQILVQLIHNAGEVVTCQSLLQSIWGKYHEDDPKVVWVQIARIRKKLELDPKNPIHISRYLGLAIRSRRSIMKNPKVWKAVILAVIGFVLGFAIGRVMAGQAEECAWRRLDTGFVRNCEQVDIWPTATPTEKPKREKSDNTFIEAGYPAPPTNVPWPRPTSEPYPAPLYPTAEPRPTPTLAPTMELP